jgi:hypothetical protein
VPETLLGRSVRCPKCQTVFKAENAAADPGFEEVPEDEDDRPRRRRPARDDDYDDADRDDDYRPRRRVGSRRAAQQAVTPPAIALIIVGGLGLLYAVINLLLAATNARQPFANMGANNPAAYKVGMAIGIALTFIWGIIVPLAGVMMLKLRNYGAAMTGVIFAMLPCNLGCLLGLPFGIWAIVVLNRPDVKRAFE